MPKTRDAFALRDLDEKRILQRPYFRQFNLPKATDAEILKSLQVDDTDSVENMEKKMSTIEKILDKLVDYHHFIVCHLNRLSRLKFAQTHPQRNDEVVVKYFSAEIKTAELIKKVSVLEEATEKQIQKKYRDTFTANLRKYRRASKLTQKELGEIVKVSPTVISRYLNGERDMPLHTMIRTAKALNVSLDKLIIGNA